MIIPDANLLLYAHIPFFKQHLDSKIWLEECLSSGTDVIGLSWQVMMAFCRISTNRRIFDVPLSIEQATEKIDILLQQPLVEIISPSNKHWKLFSKILVEEKVVGDLIMDAHLAVLAIEHNAVIATTDRDFTRFSDYIKTINPLKK